VTPREVIQVPEAVFASPADAAGMFDASLDYLAAADWASLGTQAHGEMLARLQRAQAKLTMVNAAVLAAFTAQAGYEPDGYRSARSWLVNRTGISAGAASGAVGWQRRLSRHGKIAAAMAAGGISGFAGQGGRRLDRPAARGQARGRRRDLAGRCRARPAAGRPGGAGPDHRRDVDGRAPRP
jgi:hypothetical protein